MAVMTDAELFQDCVRTGDRAALEDLFARHYPTVYHVVQKLVRQSADAGDLTQEAFLKALQAAREGRPPRDLRPWLLAAAINAVRDWKRGDRRRRREDWLFEACRRDPEGRAPERDAERREFERELEKALEAFPDEIAEPLVLHYYQNLSYAEIGEILGLPKTSVQFRLSRAIDRLRERFAARGRTSLLLLYFPVRRPSASLLAGLALMNVKKIVVLFLVLLGLAAVGRRIWTRPKPTSAAQPGTERAALAASDRATRPGAALDSAPARGLFGTVFDQDTKRPVPDALISAHDLGSAVRLETRSDEQGRYRLPCPDERGIWHLKFSRAGYASATAKAAKVSSQPRDAFLARGGTIQGRVVGPDGVSAGVFRILAVRKIFTDNNEFDLSRALYEQVLPRDILAEEAQTTYGPDGRFTIPHLQGGLYVLVVIPATGAPFDFPQVYLANRDVGVEVREGAVREVLVPTPKEGSIRMRVTDAATREPIPGAAVVPEIMMDRNHLPGAEYRHTTDAAGECTLPVRLNERGTLEWLDFSVSKEGYGTVRSGGGLEKDGGVREVKLGRPGCFQGHVRGPDGRPLENVSVYVAGDADGAVAAQAFTNAEGYYRTRELSAPRNYRVYLYDPELSQPRSLRAVVLRPGETRVVDFGPAAGAGISGRVLRQGRPCAQAGICVDALDGSRFRQVFYADDQGVFAIEGLDPGPYELSINADERLHFKRRLRLSEGERQDVLFAIGSRNIRGTLVDAVTQAPLQSDGGVELVARLLGGSEPAILTYSQKDGSFELPVETPGLYELLLSDDVSQFYTTDRLTVDLCRETAAENLRLPLYRDSGDRSIRIRLKDRDSGEPVRQDGECRFSFRGGYGISLLGSDLIEQTDARIGSWIFRVEAEEYLPERLSFELRPEDRGVERTLELRKSDAVKVTSPGAGSPAERAGIRAGDLLISCNGLRVRNKAALQSICNSLPSGQSVTLSLHRGATTLDLVVSEPELGLEAENGLEERP
jgi:RNA polymerase sigma-70 factor (ECF subfamily)